MAGENGEIEWDDAVRLDPETAKGEIQFDQPYKGRVQNVTEYGIFVQLTARTGTDIAGLVHETELPPRTNLNDFAPGDDIIVELLDRLGDGDLSLRGLAAPTLDRDKRRAIPDGDYGQMQGDQQHVEPPAAAVAAVDDAPGAITQPFEEAISTLTWLRQSGYDAPRFTVSRQEGGDRVVLQFVAEHPRAQS